MYNNGNSSKNVTGSSVVDGTMESADFPDNGLSADKIDGGTLSNVNVDDTTAANIIAQVDDNEISGDKIDAGVISNFQSTGIDDRLPTGKVLTLKDNAVGIGTNNPLTESNKTTLDLAGAWGGQVNISVSGTEHAQFGTDNYDTGYGCRIESRDKIAFKSNGTRMATLSTDGFLFGTDTAAANALDDYEEGTWTPAFSYATNAVITTSSGRYTKIGNMIWCDIKMSGISMDADASDVHITLPFAVGTDNPMSINEGKDFSFLNALNIQGAQVINSTEFKIFTADNNPITYNETTRAGTLELAIMVRV